MDIIRLLAAFFRRIVTAISAPFRMLLLQLQRTININVISAKLIQPLTKNIRGMLRLRPADQKDYFRVGGFLVYKQLLSFLVLAACAGVFLYFNFYAKKVETAPISLTEIKTDITFRYDDISIKDFSGVANITAFDGSIVYTGQIQNGVCAGNGFLFSREGYLLYEGGFENNKYSGYGVSYNPDGQVIYEGGFLVNLYDGEGKLYNSAGKKMYEGEFKNGEYSGAGKLYWETGNLLYEGQFMENKCHGKGIQYYTDGTVHYQGDFYQGELQGTGQLYNSTGQLIYQGAMHGGKINYRSLVGATLADIESAFHETPRIYYSEDGNTCFFYEKAEVVITTDCRVRVHEWETEKEASSDGLYYMPDEIESGRLESYDYPESFDFDYDDNAYDYDVDVDDFDYVEEVSYQNARASAMASNRLSTMVTPMSWLIVDPSSDSGSASSSASSSESSSASSSESSSASSSESSSENFDSQSSNSQSSTAYDSSDIGSSSESAYIVPESSEPESSSSLYPTFIDKTKTLYFEVDRDVWLSETELDASNKSKIFIKRVTVMESGAEPEDVEPIEDNASPTVEDCVAVDRIRQNVPTAFSEVVFEMDRQNKLFQRIWSINYAGRIIRKVYIIEGITFKYCYQPDNMEASVYYSIEK